MKSWMSAVFVVGIFLGYVMASYASPPPEYYSPASYTVLTGPDIIVPGSEVSVASMFMPAIDDEGKGVATVLDVQLLEGSGRALANIDKLLFWTDTQSSIRTARNVAQEVTGKDMSKYDLVYTIRANASVIEGPSAGAALTIATIAALECVDVNESIMITGTINHDGTIGPVGEITNKAKAAKYIGAQLFLVPLSQSTEVTYKSEEYCENIGWSELCTTEQVPKKVDVAQEAGIRVIEVKNISEALKYFGISN
jgi:uncharacterized protein